MEVKDKRVIVTGGASGIGEKVVERLAADGANICVFDVSRDALMRLEKKYPEVFTIVCDVGNSDAVNDAVHFFYKKVGGIDILINNAGIVHNELLISYTKEGLKKHELGMWDKVIANNLSSVFYVAASVIHTMVMDRLKGVVINVGSIAAAGNMGQSAYSAAKAGVNALTVTWAKELGAMGIRVAGIAPGFAKTETTLLSMSESMTNEWIKKTPVKRMAEPHEIADAVMFIIRNDFFNGRILEIDGGLRI